MNLIFYCIIYKFSFFELHEIIWISVINMYKKLEVDSSNNFYKYWYPTHDTFCNFICMRPPKSSVPTPLFKLARWYAAFSAATSQNWSTQNRTGSFMRSNSDYTVLYCLAASGIPTVHNMLNCASLQQSPLHGQR